ncbi:MAG: hypothetical protein BWY51_00235 [Parcubacteria group bacterium ADurb.Bin316]|nr:MAG: hypothetical protein BWY51_00235 [Parcubacteria group bacterium ADurb.Bin316]
MPFVFQQKQNTKPEYMVVLYLNIWFFQNCVHVFSALNQMSPLYIGYDLFRFEEYKRNT